MFGVFFGNFSFEEISIFSNGGHLGYRTALTVTILRGTHPGTIPATFGLIWFSSFREDLNVIFYQNMPNLHNRYKSAERKISKKKPEHMLNYSLPCSCSSNLSSFCLIQTKRGRDGPWVGPSQNCDCQCRPVSKMATVTKNRNFFKWPKLLYFKPECA
jgi:RNA recognition motif-containing protein